MLGGYNNRIAEIDLSDGTVSVHSIPEDWIKDYIGGRGFTSKVQYEEVQSDIDLLGPDNVLTFSVGPLVATLAPGGNRVVIGGKSPLTGILGDSSMGGNWGWGLKRCGFDLLIFRGRATRPVYVWISDGKIEIRGANDLWGKTTYETEKALTEELGEKVEVASIGPAGENLVRYACILSEAMAGGRAAGRTGMGAIMGSKNLKAIAVQGNWPAPLVNKRETQGVCHSISKTIREDPFSKSVKGFGTNMNLSLLNELKGGLATRNWQGSLFEGTRKISGESLKERFFYKARTCPSCSIGCEMIVKVPEGPYATRPIRVEFFPIASLGANLGNENLESVVRSFELCNDMGIDVGETGGVIAFAMECIQRGLLLKNDLDGLDLVWGNGEAILQAIEKIAYRDGIGGELAEGVKRFSRRVGKGSDRFAIHVKGLCCEIMDPRVFKIYRSGMRTASRGGDHLRGQGALGMRIDLQKRGLHEGIEELVTNEIYCTLAEMMGLCKFVYGAWSGTREITDIKHKLIPHLYSAATGINTDWNRLKTAAERVLNLERCFNLRQGITKADDALPVRFLEEPVPEGSFKGEVYDISEEFYREYCKQVGWDPETGIPEKWKLEELGIGPGAEL